MIPYAGLIVLTVIIPTYEAAYSLARLLPQLKGVRVIVADGGSSDETLDIALRHDARLAIGAEGRGQQMRLGAQLALLSGLKDDWFLFLHADSQLPHGWKEAVTEAMKSESPRYFRFRANKVGLRARVMDRMVALRCWALGLPYGDQGLLISRALYEQVGGYAPMALFEDVDLVRRLRKAAKLRPLPFSLKTDVSDHWREGVWRRGIRNLSLLWRYWRGESIESLLEAYNS